MTFNFDLSDRNYLVTGANDEALAEQVIPAMPLRRLGDPEDIARAVLFLLSDASAWVTGQVVQVAGGTCALTYPDVPDYAAATVEAESCVGAQRSYREG